MTLAVSEQPLLDAFPWVVVIVASAIGATMDVRERRLPNWLTLPLLLSGLAYWAVAGGFSGLASALGGASLVGLPYLLLFVLARGGAGDVKMMAGVGAWLGIVHGLVALVFVALAGGVLAVAVGLARGHGRSLARHLSDSTLGLMAVARGWVPVARAGSVLPEPGALHRFPYGLAILVGTGAAAIGVSTWPIA